MIKLKRTLRAPPVRVDLGRGVVLHARPQDTVALGSAQSLARRELQALRDGRDTQHPWPSELIAVIDVESAASGDGFVAYAESVLSASASVEQVEGVELDGEAVTSAAFDVFAWLFADAIFEMRWRSQAFAALLFWSAEKNGSSAGPNGSGAEASITAPDAGPKDAPAPMDLPSRISTDAADAAPSLNTRHKAPPASTSGSSQAAPESGAATVGAAA